MKSINKILTLLLISLVNLTTAHAWKVEKDGTTQMKLTDTGRLWVGADGANTHSKMSSTTTETDEDRAVDARADRTTGTNYGVVATAHGDGADMNVGLYGWADRATNNYGLYIASGYGYFNDNVGIGTLDPEGNLVVSDTTETSLNIEATNTDGNSHLKFIEKNGDDSYGVDFFYDGVSGKLTIRNQSQATYTNRMIISRTGATVLELKGNGLADAWNTNSDRRLKTEINPILNALEKVSHLKGVTYKWKDTNKSQDLQMGFIAQEVEKIVPEVVNRTQNNDQFYNMQYDKITALLVESIKELKKQNDALKALVCQDHPDADICMEIS